MYIPILFEHDTNKIYGKLDIEDGKLIASFINPISEDLFFELFPCGAIIKDPEIINNKLYISKAEIVSFSFDSTMKNIIELAL